MILLLAACGAPFGSDPTFGEISLVPIEDAFAFSMNVRDSGISEVEWRYDVADFDDEPLSLTWSADDETDGPAVTLPNAPGSGCVSLIGVDTASGDLLCHNQDYHSYALGKITSWGSGDTASPWCVQRHGHYEVDSCWGGAYPVEEGKVPIEQF